MDLSAGVFAGRLPENPEYSEEVDISGVKTKMKATEKKEESELVGCTAAEDEEKKIFTKLMRCKLLMLVRKGLRCYI